MKLKQIVTAILRILWMLRKSPPVMEPTKPMKPIVLNSKSECAATADAPAVVTFGSSCSRVLPRSQVLSLLRSDCLRSTLGLSSFNEEN